MEEVSTVCERRIDLACAWGCKLAEVLPSLPVNNDEGRRFIQRETDAARGVIEAVKTWRAGCMQAVAGRLDFVAPTKNKTAVALNVETNRSERIAALDEALQRHDSCPRASSLSPVTVVEELKKLGAVEVIAAHEQRRRQKEQEEAKSQQEEEEEEDEEDVDTTIFSTDVNGDKQSAAIANEHQQDQGNATNTISNIGDPFGTHTDATLMTAGDDAKKAEGEEPDPDGVLRAHTGHEEDAAERIAGFFRQEGEQMMDPDAA